MRVIFLDFDGVLNPGKHAARLHKLWKQGKAKSRDEYGQLFNEHCVFLAEVLVDTTEAKVVISSTWRKRLSLEQLRDMFKVRGITIDIYDVTPSLNTIRGEEIECWLLEHDEVESYVIIDDNSDMLPEQKPHFIQCSSKTGLTLDLASKACSVLFNGDSSAMLAKILGDCDYENTDEG